MHLIQLLTALIPAVRPPLHCNGWVALKRGSMLYRQFKSSNFSGDDDWNLPCHQNKLKGLGKSLGWCCIEFTSTTSLKHPRSAMNSLSSQDQQINEAAKEPSVARHILLHLQPECHLLHVASKSAHISEPFRTSKVSKPDDFPNWGDAWTHQIVGGQGQGFSGWILPTSQGSLV